MSGVVIAPSILSADFGRLAEQVQEAEEAGADWIHVDVMDGHFVPNITLGPAITAAVREATDLPVDVHLMIESPDRYVEAFVDAGASVVSVHAEADVHLHRTLTRIRELGAEAGVALNPATPIELLGELSDEMDLVVVMSVNPGFGGQRFIRASVDKIRRVRDLLGAAVDGAVRIEVDGGIDASTAGVVAAAGADVLVAGSAVYNERASVATNIATLREAAGSGAQGS